MRRILAPMLIVVSLVAASLAATTAYTPRLEAVATSPEPLTLAAPAGRDPAQPGTAAVTPGDARNPVRLTPDVTRRLESLRVRRVRVKEFSIGRWDHAWVFGLAWLGLVAGGLLVRAGARAGASSGPGRATRSDSATPASLLDAAYRDADALRQRAGSAASDAQGAELLRGIEAIQAAHLTPFVEMRSWITNRYGIGGLARVMDPFASAERQLNRAWSAAADRAFDEAHRSLDRAVASLDAARKRLAELTAEQAP